MSNNSLILDLNVLEEKPDTTPQLKEREQYLVRVIEALRGVRHSKEWSTLKTELFDGLTASLEKQLKNEARQEDLNVLSLARIAGQLKWAERYADLEKLEQTFLVELKNIRLNLYGKPE